MLLSFPLAMSVIRLAISVIRFVCFCPFLYYIKVGYPVVVVSCPSYLVAWLSVSLSVRCFICLLAMCLQDR